MGHLGGVRLCSRSASPSSPNVRSSRVRGSIGQGLSGFDGTARALKHKVLVVELHHRENERGANTEQ
jgi:hypothetical protein